MASALLIDANVGLHSGAKSRETRFVPLIAFASFAFDRVADFSGIPLKQLNKIGSENILSSTKQALAKDKVQIFRAVSSHEVVAPHLVRQRRLELLTPSFFLAVTSEVLDKLELFTHITLEMLLSCR